MNEMITIQIYIGTRKVGSECKDSFEIEREIWEEMSESEQEELCKEAAFGMMEWGFYVEES